MSIGGVFGSVGTNMEDNAAATANDDYCVDDASYSCYFYNCDDYEDTTATTTADEPQPQPLDLTRRGGTLSSPSSSAGVVVLWDTLKEVLSTGKFCEPLLLLHQQQAASGKQQQQQQQHPRARAITLESFDSTTHSTSASSLSQKQQPPLWLFLRTDWWLAIRTTVQKQDLGEDQELQKQETKEEPENNQEPKILPRTQQEGEQQQQLLPLEHPKLLLEDDYSTRAATEQEECDMDGPTPRSWNVTVVGGHDHDKEYEMVLLLLEEEEEDEQSNGKLSWLGDNQTLIIIRVLFHAMLSFTSVWLTLWYMQQHCGLQMMLIVVR